MRKNAPCYTTTMKQPMPGVNLGGWLVVEKWMTPSLFEGTDARDEYGLLLSKGGPERIEAHRRKFITEKDFKWLKAHYIEAIRIPIGYWLFEEEPPYLTGEKYLDWAFDMGEKYGIQILISLHGAPGSQNGKDHSGRKGAVRWYKRKNRQLTTRVLENLVERYYVRNNFWGIELLNEPKSSWFFTDFRLWLWTWQRLRDLARRYPQVRFVYSDVFAPLKWSGMRKGTLDIHHYQCFSASDKTKSLDEHIKKAHDLTLTLRTVAAVQPVIIGEWSAALDGMSLGGVSRHESERRFVRAQLAAFEQADAWFYWSYKTEDAGSWNFRAVVERGIFEK